MPTTSRQQLERDKETERVLGILHQWGIHTIGQLAALERDDLAARLGTRAVELWERANACAARLLKLVSPPESFIESFEFENEIETAEPLLFMLRRFLQQLATRLYAIYLAAKELRLRIIFSDKSHYERVFKIPQPTNNEEVLFRMLHTHLENFTSKHPIVAVELEAQPSQPVRQQFRLFETALRDPAQLHETLARLVGLLGAERVGTPVQEETHRPDAFRMEPFVWQFGHPERSRGVPRQNGQATPRDPSTALRGACPERSRRAQDDSAKLRIPLRRFRKRTAATVLLENNQPVHIRSGECEGMTVARAGPFAISGDWWDKRAWARVEWDLELDDGIVARCYRDHNGWVMDGIYD
jgi:protein ImuB